MKQALLVSSVLIISLVTGVQAQEFIGGSTPDVRPANAPVIVTVKKDNAWYKQALKGIGTPYPASLKFLEDQGNWYTPFTVPGMPAPYDIRGLHSK